MGVSIYVDGLRRRQRLELAFIYIIRNLDLESFCLRLVGRMLLTRREMQAGILVTAQHSARKDWLLGPRGFRGVRLEYPHIHCPSKSLDYILVLY